MAGEKTRCSGLWTEARYRSFIKGNLRQATMKWAPINIVKKRANVRRGFYLCDECKEEVPATLKGPDPKKPGKHKRIKNVHVDHIIPVVDPAKGWEGWDVLIERLFCEEDNLRVLCTACHKVVTDEEKQIAKDRRAKEKEIG